MKNSQELHRRTFELTLALYRVTDFFPQGEVLKRQLREKANEIFGNVTEYEYADGRERGALALLAKVETMKGYLRVSRSMGFVRSINLTILEREYELLERLFRQELDGDDVMQNRDRNPREVSYTQQMHDSAKIKDPKAQQRVAREGGGMTDRQKKILTFVEKVSQAKISDFHALLIGVSAKTIQRDLHDLVQKNILKKDGEKRWTTYSLI